MTRLSVLFEKQAVFPPEDGSAEYWCSVCDGEIVDSSKPETGAFFNAWGHVLGDLDAYCGVQFSVCAKCLLTKSEV